MTAQDTPGQKACPEDGAAVPERVCTAAPQHREGVFPRPSFPWAVPSWVKAGSVAENAAFLAGRVPETGLLFFEAESSANMPESELPHALCELPLRWHVHLPSSLSGQRDLADTAAGASAQGEEAARMALRCWRRASFLHPRCGVLHLPADRSVSAVQEDRSAAWLHAFFRIWREEGGDSRRIVLENVRGAAFSLLLHRPDAASDAGLCLDMAHALAYGQRDDTLRPEILKRVRLMHWSAPGPAAPDGSPQDRHLPLDRLDAEQLDWLRDCWLPAARDSLAEDTVHLIEVFDWEGILHSLPVLEDLFRRR